MSVQKQDNRRIHTILTRGGEYHFLFIEDQLVTHDGRKVLFLRTVSGVQRVELCKGEKPLYRGSRSLDEIAEMLEEPDWESLRESDR